jgi:hypothetical protein
MLALLAALSVHAPSFSEGMKGCTRVAESVYFAAHHDGNSILRLDNRSTRIIAGSELGEPGDSDGAGLTPEPTITVQPSLTLSF